MKSKNKKTDAQKLAEYDKLRQIAIDALAALAVMTAKVEQLKRKMK